MAVSYKGKEKSAFIAMSKDMVKLNVQFKNLRPATIVARLYTTAASVTKKH